MDIHLERIGAGGTATRHDLAHGALRLGRAPGNDLILTDSQVSSHHAVLAVLDGHPTITDLRSTNGTFLNGDRLKGPSTLAHADVLGLGPNVNLLVSLLPASPGTSELELEHAEAGLRLPLGPAPIRLGEHTVALRDVRGTTVTCLVDGIATRVELGATLEIDGRAWLVRKPGEIAPTVRAEAQPFPYTVITSLNGPTGPVARFEQPGHTAHEVTAENRAVLVHVLADRLAKDRVDDPDSSGWCDDGSLRTAIWGAQSRAQLANNLNVVIRRTRKELTKHGYDGTCIQKVYGHTRLHVATVR